MELTSKRVFLFDPQGQAQNYLKNLARIDKITVESAKATDSNLLRLLEKSVQFGHWFMLSGA
jgi:hypothetical protein